MAPSRRDRWAASSVSASNWISVGVPALRVAPLRTGTPAPAPLASNAPGTTVNSRLPRRIGQRPDLYARAWTPANALRVARLKAAAAARAVSPAGLATWWLLRCPFVTSIVVGACRPEQLEALAGEAHRLPPDEALWRELGEAPAGEVPAAGAPPRGAGP